MFSQCPAQLLVKIEFDEEDLNDLVACLVIRIGTMKEKPIMYSIRSRLFRLCERLIKELPNDGRKEAATHGLNKAMGIQKVPP